MRKKSNPTPLTPEEQFFRLAQKIIHGKARKLSGHFGFRESDIPDIEQELLLEIYRQKENFDPDKGSDAAFILPIVNSKTLDLIKYRQAECRDWRKCRQSLNEIVDIPDAEAMELVDLVCIDDNDNLELAVDVDIVRERLPSDLQNLCDYLLNYDISEIPEATSQSRGKLQNRMKKLRENFRNYGFSEKFL